AVEVSLANLRSAGALSVEGLRSLSAEQLQNLIRPSGFYSRKGPAIKAFIAMLDAEFGGSLDQLSKASTDALRDRFLKLPGVGAETADAILLYALGHPVPVADEYLRRIAVRHRLLEPAPEKNRKGYEALVQLTRDAFAGDPDVDRPRLFNEFHALTVAVGKAFCRKTPDCTRCPLEADLRRTHRTEDKPEAQSLGIRVKGKGPPR
ncbi:MAG TPA: hypothetical protein VGR71_02580, partial [Nitrospira sp.]|nr:hypothetical protein [Nitrospira sp.]